VLTHRFRSIAPLLLASLACAQRGSDACVHGSSAFVPIGTGTSAIRTVFVIVMENHDWSSIAGSASAPYINGTLLPQSSYATRYFGVRHPSEPNYLWLEGGTDYGINDDADPSSHHLPNRDHLVSLLDQAGISWKAYEESIDGAQCPLLSHDLYAAKHDPFVFFDDVTDGENAQSPRCISHVQPLADLSADLQANTLPRYAFIAPNLCNDMHGASGCADPDLVHAGDAWLAQWIPRLQASPAYASGVIFITWDENEGGNASVGLVVLSPLAKGGGYANALTYTHSSLLRSVQEIFRAGPLLCDAANATSLSDLFRTYP
jgi:phosphatidylinositol-3-phosphatase